MDMYEHNYMRLRCLCPQLASLQQRHLSQVDGAHGLQLTILEQTPHTSRIKLTYLMDGETRPDLIIRICHDSRQAEVESRLCRIRGNKISAAENLEDALRGRWQMNRFLYKWLNYIHRQGHGFEQSIAVEDVADQHRKVAS